MCAVLRHKVLEERHTYKGVRLDLPLMSKTERLPADAYKASAATQTIRADTVQSTTQAATWYSPSAQNIPNATADLLMLRQLSKGNKLESAKRAWVGGIFDHSHKLAFRFKDARDEVFLALSHFSDSGVLAWPCDIVRIGDMQAEFLKPRSGLLKPVVVAVVDLDAIEAWTFATNSFLHMYHMEPRHRGLLTPAILLRLTRGPMHVLEIACYNAWWLMSRTVVTRFAALKQAAVDSGASLFEALLSVTKQILHFDDEQALDLVCKRLPAEWNATHYSERLLELDQALEVIDINDREEVKATQKQAESKLDDIGVFSGEYKQKRQAVTEAKASSGAKRRRRVASSSSGPSVLPKTIPQSEAKRWIPEGASVWRSNTRNEWWGHYPPFKRVVVPWTIGQEADAMREAIRRLWRQHLEYRGLPESACPHQGIL